MKVNSHSMKKNLTKIASSFLPVVLLGVLAISCKEETDHVEPMRMFTPAGAMKSTSGETKVKLTWNPSLYTTATSGVTYTVEVAADSMFQTPVIVSVQTDTAGVVFTEDQLEVKKLYYARIKANALDTRPESKWVTSNRFSIRGEQIFAPLVNKEIRDKTVVLRWRPTTGLTKIVVTPANGAPVEYEISAEEIEASAKTITGLAATTSYKADIFAGTKHKGTVSFTTKEPSVFTETVATAAELEAAIARAASGDVIGLEPGTYDHSANNLVISEKHLTLQSVSGDPANTTVLFKEITLKGNGAGVKLSGIGFDGTAASAAYFLNLAGLGSDGEAANFTSILVENCTVNFTANCFMRANRGSSNGTHKIESIVVKNTVGSNNGTGSYHYFHLDKLEFKKLEIENSTFYNSGRAFIGWATNMTAPAKPVISINQTTINNFGFSGRNNILLDANANAVEFTMQNSIVANTPKEGTVGTSLLRASTDGSSILVVKNNNFFKLLDGATPAVELTFPSYVQLSSNTTIDLGWTGSTTNFNLPSGSEVRTGSTTSGALGDPRWW